MRCKKKSTTAIVREKNIDDPDIFVRKKLRNDTISITFHCREKTSYSH